MMIVAFISFYRLVTYSLQTARPVISSDLTMTPQHPQMSQLTIS